MNLQGNTQNSDALWGRKGLEPEYQGLETIHHLKSKMEAKMTELHAYLLKTTFSEPILKSHDLGFDSFYLRYPG